MTLSTLISSERLIGAAYPLLTVVNVLKKTMARFGKVELAAEKEWSNRKQGTPAWRVLRGAVDPPEDEKPPRGKECSFRVLLDAVYLLSVRDSINERLATNEKISVDLRMAAFAWHVEHDLRWALVSATQSKKWPKDLELTYVDAGYFDNDMVALVCCRVVMQTAT